MNDARFVISRSKVIERYNLLRGLCSGISYSTKTNPEVGRILEEETDCLFSVHTPEGIEWVNDPGRIIFLAEGMGKESFSDLIDMGIKRFVIDNRPDLDSLLSAIREMRAEVSLFLRMRFQETTVYKGRYFLFGMAPEEINELIPVLKGNPNIRKLGIHFHRNTQNTGNWSYKELLLGLLSRETLSCIDSMSIGGGIPVAYRNTNDSNIDYILGKIEELWEWLKPEGIEMIMEPGRPIAAPATVLETRIKSISGRNITVNCSVYNSSMDTIIVPHKLLVEGEGNGESYVIKGCTPCSMDIFRYDVRLDNPKTGDRIVFLNAGAYNFSSNFCNLKRPETIVVD
jgi:ornithine decarboxylase